MKKTIWWMIIFACFTTSCVKQVGDFYDGLALAKKGGKYGFINENKKVVIPCEYDSAESFQSGCARVFKKGMCGVISVNGYAIIKCEYDNCIYDAAQGLFAVCKNDNWGWIDSKGNVIADPIYDMIQPFTEGISIAHIDDNYFLIHKDGSITDVNNPPACAIEIDANHTHKIKENGKWGVFHSITGEILVPCIYDDIILNPATSIMMIKKEGKWGAAFYTDHNRNYEEKLNVPCQFDTIMYINDRKEIVAKNARSYTIYDFLGNILKQYTLDDIYMDRTEHGTCFIGKRGSEYYFYNYNDISYNGFWAYEDPKEPIKIDVSYMDFRNAIGGYIPAKKAGKWGMFRLSFNQFAVQPIYEEVRIFKGTCGDICMVKENGKWGIAPIGLNENRLIVECKYDDICGNVIKTSRHKFLWVKQNGTWRGIDPTTDEYWNSEYESFDEVLPAIETAGGDITAARVSDGWRFFLLTYNGNMKTLDEPYDEIKQLCREYCGDYAALAAVKKDNHYGLWYLKGNGNYGIFNDKFDYNKLDISFDVVGSDNEYTYLFAFDSFNKPGHIIKQVGNLKIKSIQDFSQGFAVVNYSNDEYGYINTKGEHVFTGYYQAFDFNSNGLAIVLKEEGIGWKIDQTGKRVSNYTTPEYEAKVAEALSHFNFTVRDSKEQLIEHAIRTNQRVMQHVDRQTKGMP